MVPPRDGISPVAVAGWAVTRVIAEAGECRNTLTPVGEAFRRLLRTVYVVKWLSWKRMPSSGSVISRQFSAVLFLDRWYCIMALCARALGGSSIKRQQDQLAVLILEVVGFKNSYHQLLRSHAEPFCFP